MSAALDAIRAEVEARRTQPVDGAGVDLPTHAQRLASALAVGRVDQLAHELGNVLVPLQSALERLVRVLEPARGSNSFETVERALASVARLCALHEACCREARGQDELRAALPAAPDWVEVPAVSPSELPELGLGLPEHAQREYNRRMYLLLGGDPVQADSLAFPLTMPGAPGWNQIHDAVEVSVPPEDAPQVFEWQRRVLEAALSQPEDRRWRVPVTTEVQYIAPLGTIDEHHLDAIKQKLESLRARAKLPDPLPVPDFGTLRTNAGRMSATPDPQPRMQNIPVGSGEHRLPELVLTTLNQTVSPEETPRGFAEKLCAHKDRTRAALLELVLEPPVVDPFEGEEKP